MTKKQKRLLIRIIVSAILFGCFALIMHIQGDVFPHWVEIVGYGVIYLFAGIETLWKAIRNISRGQIFDENFLMCLATIGAFGIGSYPEAVEVILFYLIGELFESIAVGRSRKAVSDLMDLCPDTAVVIRNGEKEEVNSDEVEVGETIFIAPGEKIPLDGILLKGSTTIDTSALTGESIPSDCKEGDAILSGCINLTGAIMMTVTKTAGESTAAKIMELVEESSSRKASTEKFITRFARYYTPCVVIGAVLLAFIPPVIGFGSFHHWIKRALTFLIVSCPCALVISVPLSFFGGIGCASKNGILIKGSNYLEALTEVKTVAMDKTGTLTEGKFHVTKIHAVSGTEEDLLRYAALAETVSNHPIAVSLREAYGKLISESEVESSEEFAGKGVFAKVKNTEVYAGTSSYLESKGIKCEIPDAIGTAVHVSADSVYLGYLLVADVCKSDAAEAVSSMKSAGVTKTVMLTGDHQAVADEIAKQVGIDEVHAQLLPVDKVACMQKLQKELPPKGKLAFVGDGMNDAPVLAQSDVGIAMGGLGSDAAIAAADIVILDDKPSKISLVMKIARKTNNIAKQNIVFALSVKALVLILGALGITGIGAAVFADVGVSVLAILNAVRAMKIK